MQVSQYVGLSLWGEPESDKYQHSGSSPFSPNADGELLMSKAITNIRVASNGTVSFDFMTDPTAIRRVLTNVTNEGHTQWYDLHGRLLPGEPQTPGLYINSGKLILRQTHR